MPPAPTAPATPPTSTPDSIVTRFLHDPQASVEELWSQLTHIGPQAALVAAVAASIALTVWMVRAAARRRERRRWAAGARSVRILPPPEVDPAGAVMLWANLVALLRPAWRRWLFGQPHLTFEITATIDGLTLGIWVPGAVPPQMVERAVEAAWPGARTTTHAPTDLVPTTQFATGGRLRLAEADWYPIRTDHDADPARALLGALTDLGADECAAVQVLARPVTGRRLRSAHRAAVARRGGWPTNRVAASLDLLTNRAGARPADADPERGRDLTAILAKASHPSWEAEIRYAVSTSAAHPARRARTRGRAHAIASSYALYAGRNRFARHRLARPARALAGRGFGRGDLLSVPELAAIAHLPTDATVVGLVRAGARAVPPPPAVPATGKVIGDSESGARRPVALAVADARHHLHVLGATGVGKSTLLTHLIVDDIAAGRGVVVVDPKGDLVTDLLDRLPRATVPVLIDPADRYPPALNVLEGPDPHLTVDNLVGIFRAIFERFWGPRTDDVLRAACLTLHHHGARAGAAPVLTDVPRLLADEAFRRKVTAGIGDPAGLGGFWSAYESMGDASRAQVTGPLLNKLRAFLLRDFVRQVVGSTESSFAMADVLDGTNPLLVRIPKGVLGDDTARLLGSFVVAQVWQAATHRARLGQPARVDASLYVDECQNFLTLPRSFDEMLAEARGYRLSLVLAHQHLAQLSRDLRDAISANARSKVWFNVSPEDAHTLERHVQPELTAHDLSHLPAFTVAARLVADGIETGAFTARTRPAPPPIPGRAKAARAAARRAFGRSDAQRRRTRGDRAGTDAAGLVPPRQSPPSDQGSSQYSNQPSSSHPSPLHRADPPVSGPQGPRRGPRTPKQVR